MKKYYYWLEIVLILIACCDLIFIGPLMYGDYLISVIGIILVL